MELATRRRCQRLQRGREGSALASTYGGAHWCSAADRDAECLRAPGNRGGAGVSSNDMKGIAMKSPITYALMAGALALATATPAAFAAAGDDAATSTNYKAQLDKCKDATPTYQAPCKDAVGMREATPA